MQINRENFLPETLEGLKGDNLKKDPKFIEFIEFIKPFFTLDDVSSLKALSKIYSNFYDFYSVNNKKPSLKNFVLNNPNLFVPIFTEALARKSNSIHKIPFLGNLLLRSNSQYKERVEMALNLKTPAIKPIVRPVQAQAKRVEPTKHTLGTEMLGLAKKQNVSLVSTFNI